MNGNCSKLYELECYAIAFGSIESAPTKIPSKVKLLTFHNLGQASYGNGCNDTVFK